MKIKIVAVLVAVLTLSLLVVSVPPVKAKFVLAVESWEYPDEYGQGLQSIALQWTNGTLYDHIGWFYPYTEFKDLESSYWFYNTSLVLRTTMWLNATYVGFASLAEGLNYIRHSITVSLLGETVFSQQNFTYTFGDDNGEDLYFYQHNVTLSCFNTYGGVYTVTITPEIFY